MTLTIRRISGVRSNSLIGRAFFGGLAGDYAYEVTQEEFDEFDDAGPGNYQGIEVRAELADKWDSGIRECNRRGVELRSIDGLEIRLRAMGHADAAARAAKLHSGLATAKNAPAIAAWKRATAGRVLIEAALMPGTYLVLPVNPTPDDIAYHQAVAARATDHCGWLWMREPGQYDEEFLTILRRHKTRECCPSLDDPSDERLIGLHKHFSIRHHLGESNVVRKPAGV